MGEPRRSGWQQLVLTILLCLIIVVPLAIALVHRGQSGTAAESPPRDVWVEHHGERLAGRIDGAVEELTGSVAAQSVEFEVVQDGERVYFHDDALGTVARLDPATAEPLETIDVPLGSDVQVRGGVMAIHHRDTGRIWLVDAAGELSFDPQTVQPVLELGPSAKAALTVRGELAAARVGDQALYRLGGLHQFPNVVPLDLALRDFELTAVGDRVVLLDRTDQLVIFDDGRRYALEGTGLRLQEVSGRERYVVVATPEALQLIPFDPKAKTDTVSGGGVQQASLDPRSVARPLQFGGCVYGAWGSTATVSFRCLAQDEVVQTLTAPMQGGTLQFRHSATDVVLNNVRTGDAFLPRAGLREIRNWAEVLPESRRPDADFLPETVEDGHAATVQARGTVNRSPKLEDDLAGVRPGRVGVIPVLANDRDPDGDPLQLVEITQLAATSPLAAGTAAIVDDGTAIRFVPDAGATGTLTFRYVVSDGRPGGTSTAILRVRLVDGAIDSAPEQLHPPRLALETGGEASIDVASSWHDAEGDPIHLVSAASTADTEVRFTPEGLVTVRATGAPGPRTVDLVISDGRSTRAGSLRVDVAAAGTLAPETAPDLARGTTNEAVTLDVVANDPGAGHGRPTLVHAVDASGRAGLSFDPAAGTITYRTAVAGTYLALYTVESGGRQSLGLARVDLVDAATAVQPATLAVPDHAFVRADGVATIDVLANDVGPSDGVLTVARVDVPQAAREAGVRIELLDRSLLRITTTRPLDGPVELTYALVGAEAGDTGRVTVTPVATATKPRAPIAVGDAITVRQGDLATLRPLANDTHPDGLPLAVAPTLLKPNLGDGRAEVAGDTIRFQAPTTPGAYDVSYAVVDTYGNRAITTVQITVTALDAAGNRPPTPGSIDLRATAGTPLRVTPPLGGTDPDGDFVTIAGVDTPPAQGTVAIASGDAVVYSPAATALGTDTFVLRVQDALGAPSTLTVRVGIAGAAATPAPPTALDDHTTVVRGRSVSVPVLANDAEPEGWPLVLDPHLPANDAGASVVVDGDRLVITPPPGTATFSVPYSVVGTGGARATAFVHLVVVADAAPAPPTAPDHVIVADALRGQTIVDVDARAGATHPDGLVGDLVVELVDPSSPAVLDAGTIRVTAGHERLVVPYRLTSPVTGASSIGFVIVPPIPRV